MRIFSRLLTAAILLGWTTACWALEPSNAPMKALFEEMKSHAENEKAFREAKKTQIRSVESQIDSLRAGAKAKKETQDTSGVKALQTKRLEILGEVARRDVEAAQQGMRFAQRRLDIAQGNLAAFEQKKSEAERTIASS